MSDPRHHRLAHCLLLVLLLSRLPCSVQADGGTVRLSERTEQYQITVFTSPTPLRAGPIDVSVMVQNLITQKPVSEIQVAVSAKPRGQRGPAPSHIATTAAATNKLMRATTFELRSSGWWELNVSIADASDKTDVQLDIEVAEPLPKYLALRTWIGWPAIPIVLFAIHQCLVRRVSQTRPEGENHKFQGTDLATRELTIDSKLTEAANHDQYRQSTPHEVAP